MIKIKLIGAGIVVFILSGCCLIDNSETIKEVAKPMLKHLDSFYKENKRHPTIEERNKLLLDAGCRKVKNNKCSYGWKTFEIDRYDIEEGSVTMGLSYGDTGCSFGIFSNGEFMTVGCGTNACIQWSH